MIQQPPAPPPPRIDLFEINVNARDEVLVACPVLEIPPPDGFRLEEDWLSVLEAGEVLAQIGPIPVAMANILDHCTRLTLAEMAEDAPQRVSLLIRG